MATVTITIKDMPGGKVEVKATPTFETMALTIKSGQEITSAQAYALAALRTVRVESKKRGSTLIQLPSLGR